ncbi:MAG: hypothetical protein ACRDKT_02395 [Actinomycetota bacterium]
MAHALTLKVLASYFTITSDDPEWDRVLRRLWIAFEITDEPAHASAIAVSAHDLGWAASFEEKAPVTGPDPWLLADEIRHFIVDTALDGARDRFVDLHGACLAKDSRCVLLVGGTGSGKTTLTVAMGDDGWDCLSDDISIIDRSSEMVIAFPKPVGVRDIGMWERFKDRWDVPSWPVRPAGALLMPPDVLELGTRDRAAPTHLAFVEFSRNAETAMHPLSTAQAVARTGPFTRRVDPPTLSLLTKVVSKCETAGLTYGGVEEGIAALNRWIEAADD